VSSCRDNDSLCLYMEQHLFSRMLIGSGGDHRRRHGCYHLPENSWCIGHTTFVVCSLPHRKSVLWWVMWQQQLFFDMNNTWRALLSSLSRLSFVIFSLVSYCLEFRVEIERKCCSHDGPSSSLDGFHYSSTAGFHDCRGNWSKFVFDIQFVRGLWTDELSTLSGRRIQFL